MTDEKLTPPFGKLTQTYGCSVNSGGTYNFRGGNWSVQYIGKKTFYECPVCSIYRFYRLQAHILFVVYMLKTNVCNSGKWQCEHADYINALITYCCCFSKHNSIENRIQSFYSIYSTTWSISHHFNFSNFFSYESHRLRQYTFPSSVRHFRRPRHWAEHRNHTSTIFSVLLGWKSCYKLVTLCLEE